MCDYQGYEFGAGRYPDSYCIDGFLHDADSDYLNEERIPCPMCDREAAIQWWTDRNSFFVEDENETEEQAMVRARKAATSLVDDIRKNRGVEHNTPPERGEGET